MLQTRWEQEAQGSKRCTYSSASTLCGNLHIRAKIPFGLLGMMHMMDWCCKVVGDVAKGVWPMASYLQTMVGRGPSPHHLGTYDRIRPRIACKENVHEPSGTSILAA